jgi:hypothetical protein
MYPNLSVPVAVAGQNVIVVFYDYARYEKGKSVVSKF